MSKILKKVEHTMAFVNFAPAPLIQFLKNNWTYWSPSHRVGKFPWGEFFFSSYHWSSSVNTSFRTTIIDIESNFIFNSLILYSMSNLILIILVQNNPLITPAPKPKWQYPFEYGLKLAMFFVFTFFLLIFFFPSFLFFFFSAARSGGK